MLNKYAIIQTFKINDSFLFKVWSNVFHLLAGVSILINSWEWVYKILFIILLLLSLAHCLKQDSAKKSFSIRFNSLQGWAVAWFDQDYCAINILESTVVTPYIIILHFEWLNESKQQSNALVMNDALTHNEYRQLSVMLKVSGIKKEKI